MLRCKHRPPQQPSATTAAPASNAPSLAESQAIVRLESRPAVTALPMRTPILQARSSASESARSRAEPARAFRNGDEAGPERPGRRRIQGPD
jgi:hypothetical protein